MSCKRKGQHLSCSKAKGAKGVCPEHPRRKLERQPQTRCLDCWRAWAIYLRDECAEMQHVFDLQDKRMGDATKLWRKATGKQNISPDLGALLEWLMAQRSAALLFVGLSNQNTVQMMAAVEMLRDKARWLIDAVRASASPGSGVARLAIRLDHAIAEPGEFITGHLDRVEALEELCVAVGKDRVPLSEAVRDALEKVARLSPPQIEECV